MINEGQSLCDLGEASKEQSVRVCWGNGLKKEGCLGERHKTMCLKNWKQIP